MLLSSVVHSRMYRLTDVSTTPTASTTSRGRVHNVTNTPRDPPTTTASTSCCCIAASPPSKIKFKTTTYDFLPFFDLRTSVFERHLSRSAVAQPATRRPRDFYPTYFSISTTPFSNCNVRRRQEHRKFPILLFTLEIRHRRHLIEWREADVVGG